MPRDRGRATAAPGAPNVGGFGGADAAVSEVSRSCPEIEVGPRLRRARRTLGGRGGWRGRGRSIAGMPRDRGGARARRGGPSVGGCGGAGADGGAVWGAGP